MIALLTVAATIMHQMLCGIAVLMKCERKMHNVDADVPLIDSNRGEADEDCFSTLSSGEEHKMPSLKRGH